MSAARTAAARRVGVWLVGARGSISTCVAYGLAGLRAGLVEPLGMVTQTEPFTRLDLASLDSLVVGGHDICTRGLTQSAGELVRNRILSAELVTSVAAEAAAFESRIRPGILDPDDVGVADLHPEAARLGSLAPREQIAILRADFEQFARDNELDEVVVINVASTEARRDPRPHWRSLEALDAALDAKSAEPASLVYAYAALSSGRPFVNFTPSLGASTPALRELARKHGAPHCGNDGKTGETLVKTVLAPLFVARRLRVLAWQGYNMLGNRDGECLSDPLHRDAKLKSKDEALRQLLGDPQVHTKVGIDFVPSLRDWKTAWDFIHFEGFLGAQMSLQFTWAGSDSALAAPLVIDLALLADFARQRGEAGEMQHTASFFKAPIGGGTHDFHAQFQRLVEYAEKHARR
ncbi:MAG: inositol-3-phosphate synthase [Planctomycetes bacterium]|nr:inositol-3-phosphate synthase [Planctomycetota bacterium]